MMKDFNVSDRIGDIVSVFPGASDLFKKYDIDFCCGGNRPLMDAIAGQNLDEAAILEELNNEYKRFQVNDEKYTDWAKESPGKLVDHIVSRHHGYLNAELPRLSELTLKILKVHGGRHKELYEVHKLFNTLRTELEEHLVKEEEIIFPMIKEYEIIKDNESLELIKKLINELESEHTAAGYIIKQLREITKHFTVPDDACRTFGLTYRKLSDLESDIFQHIHLENNILFKNI